MSAAAGEALDLSRHGISIVPGPRLGRTGMSSVDLSEIEEVEPERVAHTLLAIPGTRLTSDARPASWEWRAEFESPESRIYVRMTLLEPQARPPLWGGFDLGGLATPRDVARIARHLKDVHRGVWLHDANSIMYAPEDFEAEFRA